MLLNITVVNACTLRHTTVYIMLLNIPAVDACGQRKRHVLLYVIETHYTVLHHVTQHYSCECMYTKMLTLLLHVGAFAGIHVQKN